MHRFALGDYLLQITQKRMLLITSYNNKEKNVADAREKVVELVTLSPWEV